MAKRTPEEVCIEYAIAMEVARTARWILSTVPCEFEEAPDPETGYDGEPACTRPYANNDDGMCDNCEKHRMPALRDLQEARKRAYRARRSIEAVGKRLIAVKP
jgi:hypothetical protein